MKALLRRVAIAVVALLAGAADAQPTPDQIAVQPIVGGFADGLGIAVPADDSDRIFVIEQGSAGTGAVRIVRNGARVAGAFLTIDADFRCREHATGPMQTVGFSGGGEQGLLGLAFHPNYERNGHVFVSFTDHNGDSHVARLTNAAPADDVLDAADLASCRMVLHIDQDFDNHNGGHVLFGPDGYLYFALGDGGAGNDPCNRAQTLDPAALVGAGSGGSNGSDCEADDAFLARGGDVDSRALLGKILRIDVDRASPPGASGLCGAHPGMPANYAIPADNPFFGDGVANGCDEVWMIGQRNPWRFSFDRANGDLYIADVGQGAWEEINRFASAGGAHAGRGANAHWNTCEGTRERGSCSIACAAGAEEVILEYRNQGNCAGPQVTGCAVTGGYRYRGPDPVLQGLYFFGDACRSDLHYSVDLGANVWVQPTGATTKTGAVSDGTVRAFGEDNAGAVYVISGATLYRIGAAPRPTPIFANAFE